MLRSSGLTLGRAAGVAGHQLVEHGGDRCRGGAVGRGQPRPFPLDHRVTPGPITVIRYFSPGAAGRIAWLGYPGNGFWGTKL